MKYLFFFILCTSYFLSFSQKKESLQTPNPISVISSEELEVKQGNILTQLPEIIPIGSNVSGTINLRGVGKNEKQELKNLQELQTYTIFYNGELLPISSSQQFTLRLEDQAQNFIQIMDGGEEVMRHEFKVDMDPKLYEFQVPNYMMMGDNNSIIGDFDGDLLNTELYFNDLPVTLMAESQYGLYFKVPKQFTGEVEVRVVDGEKIYTSTTSVLSLKLSVGKFNLKKGEMTSLNIEVGGLQQVDQEVPLFITNQTPSIILLTGGNSQSLMIDPNKSGDVFKKTLPIQGIQRGDFSLYVEVIPPEIIEEETPTLTEVNIIENEITFDSESEKCDCYLPGNHLALTLSIENCKNLGGSCEKTDFSGSPTILEEVELPPAFEVEIPEQVEGDNVPIEVKMQPEDEIIGLTIEYKPVDDEEWTALTSTFEVEETYKTELTTESKLEGQYAIRTKVVNQKNSTQEDISYTYVAPKNTFENASVNELQEPELIEASTVYEAQKKANQTRSTLREVNRKYNSLLRQLQQALQQKRTASEKKEELETIDKVLDLVPTNYENRLKQALELLEKLKASNAGQPDKEALEKALQDAKKKLEDCEKRNQELKQKQSELEKEREKAKQDLLDALEKMDQLHFNNGWKGKSGINDKGRYYFGYISDEGANTDIDAEYSEIRKSIKDAQRRLTEKQNQVDEIEDQINQNDCEKLKEEVEAAEKAKENGDQTITAQQEVKEVCDEIQNILQTLRRWCDRNPRDCSFRGVLNRLLNDCPEGLKDFESYYAGLNQLIEAKQAKEKQFGEEADAAEEKAKKLQLEAEELERQKRELEEKLAQEMLEAERLRKKRQQQLEAERNKASIPKPKPNLPEPIHPDDDQLKFQAQRVFRDLFRDATVDKGPCDCVTKSLAFANNTNSVVSDIIGGIGVGVAFAPLEAFPGFSLGARLGVSVFKSIASSLFGGADVSEELVKNMFGNIGGEILPGLASNAVSETILGQIAGKGLDAIFEEEGVKAIQWEGSTVTRNCGEVKGKTTMLFNSNTGWVSILIKIEGCPLVIVKYQVNEDGVPITTPTTTTIKG